MNLFFKVFSSAGMAIKSALAVMLFLSFTSFSHAEIVMFEQKGCVACKDFKRKLGKKYRYKRVNVHSKAYRKYKKRLKYGVTFVPTFVKFRKKKEVGRIGYGSKKSFLRNIKKLRRK